MCSARYPLSPYIMTCLLILFQLASQLGAARTLSNWVALPPLESAEQLGLVFTSSTLFELFGSQLDRKRLKSAKVNTLVWPPKVHNTVQLDEIYQLIPDMADIRMKFSSSSSSRC